jgi:hypothetical protein
MQNSVFLEKNITEVLAIFSKVVGKDKQLILKKLNGQKFELTSAAKYEKVNMMEKERYFISGQFVESDGKTHLNYTIRANATYRIIGFLILPLMSLPTLVLGLARTKAINEGASNGWLNVLIYSVIVILGGGICLFQDRKLRVEGERAFGNLIEKMD